MKRRYRVRGAMHEAILKPSSEAQTFSELTGEDMGQCSAGPINKAVPSFASSLTRVRER